MTKTGTGRREFVAVERYRGCGVRLADICRSEMGARGVDRRRESERDGRHRSFPCVGEQGRER